MHELASFTDSPKAKTGMGAQIREHKPEEEHVVPNVSNGVSVSENGFNGTFPKKLNTLF